MLYNGNRVQERGNGNERGEATGRRDDDVEMPPREPKGLFTPCQPSQGGDTRTKPRTPQMPSDGLVDLVQASHAGSALLQASAALLPEARAVVVLGVVVVGAVAREVLAFPQGDGRGRRASGGLDDGDMAAIDGGGGGGRGSQGRRRGEGEEGEEDSKLEHGLEWVWAWAWGTKEVWSLAPKAAN